MQVWQGLRMLPRLLCPSPVPQTLSLHLSPHWCGEEEILGWCPGSLRGVLGQGVAWRCKDITCLRLGVPGSSTTQYGSYVH